MKLKILFLEEFGRAFVPERIRPHLRKYLLKAGITEVPYKFFGALFYVSLIVTYLIYFYLVYPLLQAKEINMLFFLLITFAVWFMIQIGISAFFILAIYSYLDVVIYNRTKKIEDVLDSFLSFVSENLKGGMSLDKALWEAIKPEFGVLSKEIQITSKKVATGEDVEEALREFTLKYDSPMTRRAFDLIIEGAKGGGEMATLIDKVVDNIIETKLLKQDIVATNMTYVIFISFIVIIIAPALFALSHQLLLILQSLSGKMGVLTASAVDLPLSFESLSIKIDDFVLFSRVAVGVVAVCSSMIVSEITTGSIKGGLKYIPIYLVTAIFSYTFLSIFLKNIFGGLFF
ncbi:hypothetical protein A3K72_02750 [Candidatus Woesearchaeota archaeon RBG_13_36_6]|nr:MAG: hypothetical protein A3K72_02750 [Candidatus Woesearchaeota archaeon RBG_13_36_6]